MSLSEPAGQSPPAEPEARNVAVIDIGSNSVRLVLFRLEGRALFPVFNEKTMAGLGRGASETGTLNPDGVTAAMRTLKRFSLLLEAKQITEIHAVATAAVRTCEDGPDFVARVAQETGLHVRVLSGEDEGRLSAAGVIAGIGGLTLRGWLNGGVGSGIRAIIAARDADRPALGPALSA